MERISLENYCWTDRKFWAPKLCRTHPFPTNSGAPPWMDLRHLQPSYLAAMPILPNLPLANWICMLPLSTAMFHLMELSWHIPPIFQGHNFQARQTSATSRLAGTLFLRALPFMAKPTLAAPRSPVMQNLRAPPSMARRIFITSRQIVTLIL